MKLRIVIVSSFYSRGMGYTENCLPKYLALLGHDVHVVTSLYNVYGNQSDYSATYESFIGPACEASGKFGIDGYTVHRLATKLIGGYVWLRALARKMSELKPDVVHSLEHGSLLTFHLAALKPIYGFELFTESHQHLSVVRSYLLRKGSHFRKMFYWITRTVPGYLASLPTCTCYAIAPDCAEVAHRFFGVPKRKIEMQPLGSDVELFRPPVSSADIAQRVQARAALGVLPDDILCVYTGRFSVQKNPLLLAQAIDRLSRGNVAIKGVFVGEGSQKVDIEALRNSKVLSFMRHAELADIYRCADIAVWPREESMSMLDAASTGLPLVVSDKLGESARVSGSGLQYHENDLDSLVEVLVMLLDAERRRELGAVAAEKMRRSYNWVHVAEKIGAAFEASRQRVTR